MTENMSAERSENFRHYELLYLIPNTYTDAEVEGIAKKVTARVAKSTAITLNQNLGKKRLAYPIDHMTHGNYVVVEFDAEPENIPALTYDLRLTEELLRHQIIEKRKRTEEEIQTELKRRAETDRRIAQEREGGNRRQDAPKKEAVKVQASADQLKQESGTEKDHKITLEQLDEKLDEILEGKDLV
ncbi:MAG: 30S ribosomal protein S6 [Parcubacteria group bacterium CG08_land_8_20_14_0_20_48_21]|nr:MAG: 30S ribosomal protein S6 [Parcubacteria group bacterium CG08_land_8_20_14_0_20_48_21]